MNRDDIPSFGIGTQLAMLGRDPAEQYGFVNGPLYRGSTVIYKTLDDIEQRRARFSYGTVGTPTIANLEDAWTRLAGAAGTVLSPSGLGAVSLALFSSTRAGDHILVPDSVYRPTRHFCNHMLARYGVTTTYYDPMIGAGIEALMRPETTTLFLEAPGSQTFEVPDLPALVAVARRRGVRTILDNTWATPLFLRAHELGIDLTVEAGTKYLGGHSDLLLGLVTANAECWPALRATYDSMAMLPGAEDCVLALRGLRTLKLRLEEAGRRGLEMAHWLKARPEVKRVLHPAFEDCPGHVHWKRDFKGASGLFSIVLEDRFSHDGLAAMLDNLRVFSMGFSWGGYESLVIPFDCRSYRTATTWTEPGFCLRLQIGLEDMDDLKADLADGFARLAAR